MGRGGDGHSRWLTPCEVCAWDFGDHFLRSEVVRVGVEAGVWPAWGLPGQ